MGQGTDGGRAGWLVTYQHDLSSSAALEIEDGGVEVRLAVMQSQFGCTGSISA